MAKLDGKVAVVTGASSGIGAATAEALAAEGAALVLAARREDRLAELKEKIESSGGRATTVTCDVTDEDEARRLIEGAEREFGGVDILVNNAGVMLLSRIERGLTDEWRRMFDVNVMGLLYATDAAVEVMKRQGSGHIVNVSSVAGRKVRETGGVYSGTKYAVNAISEALRIELQNDDIRVTVIEPGAVATELPTHITDEEARQGMSRFEGMEILEAEDIASAIAYCVTRPGRMSVNEMLIRPTRQPN